MDPMGFFVTGLLLLVMAANAGRRNQMNHRLYEATDKKVWESKLLLHDYVYNLKSIARLTKPKRKGRGYERQIRTIEHNNWDYLYKIKEREADHGQTRR